MRWRRRRRWRQKKVPSYKNPTTTATIHTMHTIKYYTLYIIRCFGMLQSGGRAENIKCNVYIEQSQSKQT